MSHPVCTICLEIITPSSEVLATFCGHIFHCDCLTQWVKQRKTCPQCRAAVDTTARPSVKLFLVYGNNNTSSDDPETLQLKYDNLKFQNTLKDKDIKNYKEKYDKIQEQVKALKAEIVSAENQIRDYKTTQNILREKITYFKSRTRDCETLSEEIVSLKKEIQELRFLKIALEGSKEELNEMLRNVSDPKTMTTMIASLKQALVNLQAKDDTREYYAKRTETELVQLRKKYKVICLENMELRAQSRASKALHEKSQIPTINLDDSFTPTETVTMNQFVKDKKPIVPTSTVTKTVFFSDKNRCSPIVVDDSDSDSASSPSLDKTFEALTSMQPCKREEKSTVNQFVKSEPSCSSKIQMSSQNFVQQKVIPEATAQPKVLKPSSVVSSVSIFRKHKQPRMDNVGSSGGDGMVYNGLGGQSKEDIFPSAGCKKRRY